MFHSQVVSIEIDCSLEIVCVHGNLSNRGQSKVIYFGHLVLPGFNVYGQTQSSRQPLLLADPICCPKPTLDLAVQIGFRGDAELMSDELPHGRSVILTLWTDFSVRRPDPRLKAFEAFCL